MVPAFNLQLAHVRAARPRPVISLLRLPRVPALRLEQIVPSAVLDIAQVNQARRLHQIELLVQKSRLQPHKSGSPLRVHERPQHFTFKLLLFKQPQFFFARAIAC